MFQNLKENYSTVKIPTIKSIFEIKKGELGSQNTKAIEFEKEKSGVFGVFFFNTMQQYTYPSIFISIWPFVGCQDAKYSMIPFIFVHRFIITKCWVKYLVQR